jgi:transcriptional regulator with XRE-family HTH domain
VGTLATAANKFPFAANGARIQKARKRTGLSQEAFAPKVGTTRRHMIRLERGQHLPKGELRDRIVDVTGTEEQIQSADDEEEPDLSMSLDTFLRLHIQQLVREATA